MKDKESKNKTNRSTNLSDLHFRIFNDTRLMENPRPGGSDPILCFNAKL